MKSAEELNVISKLIVDSFYSVHAELGPGLLESVYEVCLIQELKIRKLNTLSQVSLPVIYKGQKLDKHYIVDLLVEDEIIIEIKSVDLLLPVFKSQLLSYMRLSGKRLGFLVNFNVPVIKSGIQRIVNNF